MQPDSRSPHAPTAPGSARPTPPARGASLTVAEIAALVNGTVEGTSPHGFVGVSSLEDAGPEHVSFLANKRYAPDLQTTRAGAILVDRDTPRGGCAAAFVRVADPSLALVALVGHFA